MLLPGSERLPIALARSRLRQPKQLILAEAMLLLRGRLASLIMATRAFCKGAPVGLRGWNPAASPKLAPHSHVVHVPAICPNSDKFTLYSRLICEELAFDCFPRRSVLTTDGSGF